MPGACAALAEPAAKARAVQVEIISEDLQQRHLGVVGRDGRLFQRRKAT
jgi:hypothetical protein